MSHLNCTVSNSSVALIPIKVFCCSFSTAAGHNQSAFEHIKLLKMFHILMEEPVVSFSVGTLVLAIRGLM